MNAPQRERCSRAVSCGEEKKRERHRDVSQAIRSADGFVVVEKL
jgi:hypothetical protein